MTIIRIGHPPRLPRRQRISRAIDLTARLAVLAIAAVVALGGFL